MRRTAVVLILCLAPSAQAGLYYSGEAIADLPSQWRGFLIDQRALRLIASRTAPPSAERAAYLDALKRLDATAKTRKLSADEWADQGALLVRLGETARAVELLRAGQREHPHHFRIASNLGTAHQMAGDLDQAAAALLQAVRLAPGKLVEAEKAQLRLVRLRRDEARDASALDDLFGVRYLGEGEKYVPGQLAASERKKLSANAVAVAQQLALWLPGDVRLLWQLAELAGAHGDVRTAAAIMDGCVNEFGLRDPALRQHRLAMRAAAEDLARASAEGSKVAHDGHPGLKPRSSRPLANKADTSGLPAVSADGVNALPWPVLNDTALDRQYRPTFPKYLRELDGKQVVLTGYVQPLGDDLELSTFLLIEFPVGCWYCEMPDVTGIVCVELPAGKSATYTRDAVKIEGKLSLNATDPENFLFTLSQAKVVSP